MAGRSGRRARRAVAAGCCLILALLSLAGASSARHVIGSAGELNRLSLRILQLNLCDSGIAGCYTGRSVRAAAALIRVERPDVVTLDEICRPDLSVLKVAMTDAHSSGVVVAAFQAATDRRTNSPFRCRNGRRYGIGLLAALGSPGRFHTYRGGYPVQDAGDPEERVWLCLDAIADVYACATHLASHSSSAAVAQCGYLLHTVIPMLVSAHGHDPVVLGADLNLTPGGRPDARSCLVPGYRWADDGALQYVVASPGFTVRSSQSLSMHGTTDHPALLVDLRNR